MAVFEGKSCVLFGRPNVERKNHIYSGVSWCITVRCQSNNIPWPSCILIFSMNLHFPFFGYLTIYNSPMYTYIWEREREIKERVAFAMRFIVLVLYILHTCNTVWSIQRVLEESICNRLTHLIWSNHSDNEQCSLVNKIDNQLFYVETHVCIIQTTVVDKKHWDLQNCRIASRTIVTTVYNSNRNNFRLFPFRSS